jgi:thiamine phosphate synthase YjbQ (UPF0047 family)
VDERSAAAGHRFDHRDVEKAVAESGVKEGLVLVKALPSTASSRLYFKETR